MDDYCVLCQDAHKMISSCFQDVQCKNCSEKGHLRIDCPQDVEVENKSTRFEVDCESVSKDYSEVAPKCIKIEGQKIKQESLDDNNNDSVDFLKVEHQTGLCFTKQGSSEAVFSIKKEETETALKHIVKGEYFEDTPDLMNYGGQWDFDTLIVPDIKKENVDSDNPDNRAKVAQIKSEKRARKRKKKKKEKLPGQPKKPTSAFFIWFNEEGRELMAEENPGGSVTERARSAGARWKVLDETSKKKYEELHEELRGKYKEDYKEWFEGGGKELIKQAKEKKKEAQLVEYTHEKTMGKKNIQQGGLSRGNRTEFQSKEFISDSDSDSD